MLLDSVLGAVCASTNPSMVREALVCGTGLLFRVADYRRELRPLLAAFSHAFSTPNVDLGQHLPSRLGGYRGFAR